MKELGLRPGKNETLHLECQGSSTSFYKEDWLNAFYHALPSAKSVLGSRLPPLKVLFPSEKAVNESLEGRDWAISWFCQAKGELASIEIDRADEGSVGAFQAG